MKHIVDELIKVAAEMALRRDMPPTFIEDWHFPKYISEKQAVRVVSASYLADNRCRQWSITVRSLADKLSRASKTALICECGDHINESDPHAHRDGKNYCQLCLE